MIVERMKLWDYLRLSRIEKIINGNDSFIVNLIFVKNAILGQKTA